MDKQQEEDEEDESVEKEWLSRRDRRNREKKRKRVRAWESVRVFSAIVKSILSCTYVYVSSEMRARAHPIKRTLQVEYFCWDSADDSPVYVAWNSKQTRNEERID